MTASKLQPSDSAKELIVKEKELEQKLENYRDIEGIVTKRLVFGVWYLQHRRMFFLSLVWFLSIIATVLWCYSLYYFGYYLLIGVNEDRIMNQAATDELPQAIRKNQMLNFSFQTTNIIKAGNDRFDVIGEVNNQNAKSWASYDYYFLVDGQQIAAGSDYVLPQSKKFLTAVLEGRAEAPSYATLVVYNVSWNNLNIRQVPDWDEYKKSRLNFSIRDKEFVNSSLSALSERLPINTLSFEISNDTAFSYFEARLQIMLYSGDEIVAVKDYVINGFNSRDRKNIIMTVVGQLPSITNIEIIPEINIIDQAVYLTSN